MFYYGINLVETINGTGLPPALIVPLLQRLPDTSLTAALASGGREHFGWGMDRHLSAHIYDAIGQNTRASGQWGKKGPPTIDPFPRPKSKGSAAKKKPVSVKEIYKRFQRR